jgi:hypothetical protein
MLGMRACRVNEGGTVTDAGNGKSGDFGRSSPCQPDGPQGPAQRTIFGGLWSRVSPREEMVSRILW